MTTGLRKVWEWPACYCRSGYDLPRPILIFVAAKENGFACCGRRGNDPPRPILIFVAAKENGFACYGRRGNDPPRPILIFVAAEKMARLQNTTTPTDASILDFKPRLENRCKDFPENNLLRTSILDFRARLGNQCMVLPVYPPLSCIDS